MDIEAERGSCSGNGPVESKFPAMLTIPMADVAGVWPKVSPLFLVFEEQEPLLYTRSDIFRYLAVGLMQLHLSHDGEKFHLAVITELVQYPQTKICRIILGTGEKPEITFELYPWMEKWCQENEVQWLELVGRPGWERVVKPLCFDKTSVILSKRIGNHGRK